MDNVEQSNGMTLNIATNKCIVFHEKYYNLQYQTIDHIVRPTLRQETNYNRTTIEYVNGNRQITNMKKRTSSTGAGGNSR